MQMLRFRLIATVFVLAALAGASARTQETPRILVSNDDGWDSPGLSALVETLSDLGEVVVSAPLENQSGSSHSFGAMRAGLAVRGVEVAGAAEAWAVDGTPAAATAFGLRELGRERPFDLVVSGINRGANVGDVSHNSGTVGAAMQAAMDGIPSIASSLDLRGSDYSVAARYTALVAEAALHQPLPLGLVLSINVPVTATAATEVAVRQMGGVYLMSEGFEKISETDGVATWRPRFRLVETVAGTAGQDRIAGSDTVAYLEGRITVTPLRYDWTAYEQLDWVRSWLPATRN